MLRPTQSPVKARSPPSSLTGIHVPMLPDFDRADRIGEFWGNPKTRPFAELLIDCEEDWTLRAVHSDGEDVLVASDLVR
jgi:hypothetical protein